ncbi:MAG: hypothetical protein PHV13_03025 [Candidatus ainarchaeum sp.]|nr:hypothetical protein [Candidatus ainarchaeum sp.]
MLDSGTLYLDDKRRIATLPKAIRAKMKQDGWTDGNIIWDYNEQTKCLVMKQRNTVIQIDREDITETRDNLREMNRLMKKMRTATTLSEQDSIKVEMQQLSTKAMHHMERLAAKENAEGRI